MGGLGPLLGGPGPLLGPPETTLGEVWGVLEPPLARSGPLFGRSWPLSGGSCERAGSLWGALGWPRAAQEGLKSLPRPILRLFWDVLGRILGGFWGQLESYFVMLFLSCD